MKLDHENLDVYKVSVDFAGWAHRLCRELRGMDRYSRDQFLRASQSIALNIAEGCGKKRGPDRRRYYQISNGSARECAAILDILLQCSVIDSEAHQEGKNLVIRLVSMLTSMIMGK